VARRPRCDNLRRLHSRNATGEREWRNWQTRTVQVRVPVRAWGFKSPLAHRGLIALLPSGNCITAQYEKAPEKSGAFLSGGEVWRKQVRRVRRDPSPVRNLANDSSAQAGDPVILPQTYRTTDGFTVDGASPALLRELLDMYISTLDDLGVRTKELFVPGIPESVIRDSLAELGLVPTDELIVWWNWRNGVKLGLPRKYVRFDFLSVERSMQGYRTDPMGMEEALWNPSWIRVIGPSTGIAVRLGDSANPLVRGVSPTGFTTNSPNASAQVVSLCTPVTWWLRAIANGWTTWVPGAEGWGRWVHRRDEIPLEWEFTAMV
jgi:hypothetical protein